MTFLTNDHDAGPEDQNTSLYVEICTFCRVCILYKDYIFDLRRQKFWIYTGCISGSGFYYGTTMANWKVVRSVVPAESLVQADGPYLAIPTFQP